MVARTAYATKKLREQDKQGKGQDVSDIHTYRGTCLFLPAARPSGPREVRVGELFLLLLQFVRAYSI